MKKYTINAQYTICEQSKKDSPRELLLGTVRWEARPCEKQSRRSKLS
jgi:hypothetical protein